MLDNKKNEDVIIGRDTDKLIVKGDAKIEGELSLNEINSKNSFRSFFGLKTYLENNFHKKVDLGIESSLKPIVKEYVSKEIIYV